MGAVCSLFSPGDGANDGKGANSMQNIDAKGADLRHWRLITSTWCGGGTGYVLIRQTMQLSLNSSATAFTLLRQSHPVRFERSNYSSRFSSSVWECAKREAAGEATSETPAVFHVTYI
jgi:hypothetical protein